MSFLGFLTFLKKTKQCYTAIYVSILLSSQLYLESRNQFLTGDFFSSLENSKDGKHGFGRN